MVWIIWIHFVCLDWFVGLLVFDYLSLVSSGWGYVGCFIGLVCIRCLNGLRWVSGLRIWVVLFGFNIKRSFCSFGWFGLFCFVCGVFQSLTGLFV